MKLLQLLARLAAAAALAGCTATVTAQFVGAGVLWSRGMLAQDKMVRYAGVLYGLEPIDLAPSKPAPDKEHREPDSREETLSDRVRNSPDYEARQAALRKGTDDIRTAVLGLRVKRERQDLARKAFESYLDQLETDNATISFRDLRTTLESLSPKQAKDIVYGMLTDPDSDPSDDVMSDLVGVLKSMSVEKTSKLFKEFKTDDERDLLHDILVEIGQLSERGTALTGAQP